MARIRETKGSEMNRHEFHLLAQQQGQKRFSNETLAEFEKRVLDLKEKQDARPAWLRRDNVKG